MTLQKLITGLNILSQYYKDRDGYSVGAERDEIYLSGTDKVVSEADVQKLSDLGWFQTDTEIAGEEWTPTDYDPEAPWSAYV